MSVVYVSGEKSVFSVGRDPGADLVLESTFVSRRHLLFRTLRHDVARVEVSGTNGALVKGIQVNKGYSGYIRAGDCVSVGDIRLVWTGRKRAKPLNRGLVPVKRIVPEAETVEIEGPPQRRVPEKPSVMLAAGPALTMAIPILLGAGRRIAVLSSVFAAVWAVANVFGRVRRQRTDENRRRNTYLSYMSECEELIKSRLKESINTLNDLYPPVDKYFCPDKAPSLLWTGVPGDNDDLPIRLGIGETESPVKIVIPRERFAGIDDSLREFPGLIRDKYRIVRACPIIVYPQKGSVTGFSVNGESDRQALSALILQLAAVYSPKVLGITVDAGSKLMQYYMWIAYLPHYRQSGPECRVLITDDNAKAFDEAARGSAVILITDPSAVLLSGPVKIINEDSIKMRFDVIPPEFCYSYAAEMAALWGDEADEGIPAAVPFGKLMDERFLPQGYMCPDEAAEEVARKIAANYRQADITENIRAPIGLKEKGLKHYLDLHERFAGPHGLIAGTTGSGKSELLTTIILSFAAAYPPDKLAFFLIDYKGGGMSNLFADLPHLAGNISNLTGSLTQRAMTALGSENVRRQEIFAACSVNNIGDYMRLYEEGGAPEPLPHILIIVDEFAELRRKEPEFMDRLISISQVGRSLGMHLILATQKPAGVVDDKIRSNSGFRIALRLVDRSDSMDMLQRPDAVSIKDSGRAYMQVAKDGSFECFQSGYAMAPVFSGEDAPRLYTDFYMTEEIKTPWRRAVADAGSRFTWYELVMKAVLKAKDAYGMKAPKLWLPPLPSCIEDDEAFAVFDDPYGQRYVKMPFDPDETGHVLIMGRSGSGKSELVSALINRLTKPAAVYIIDHGGGRLEKLAKYEYCGGYIGDDDKENIVRLTGFIDGMLTKRRRAAKTDGPFTPVLLVTDNLEEVRNASSELFLEHLRRILTLGKSVGIYVIATVLGVNTSKDEKYFDTCLFLGSVDPYIVSSAFRVPVRSVPRTEDIPGRGLGLVGDDLLEFQTVMTNRDGDRSPPHKLTAPRYPYVPTKPALDDLLARAATEIPPPDDPGTLRKLPAGYEQVSGRLYTIPLDRTGCVLITGKAYSGRHTLLFNISIIAAYYRIKCVRADTYEAILSYCEKSTKFTIFTISSLTDLLDEFYKSAYTPEEEDKLCSFFENPGANRPMTKNSFLVVGVIDNEARMKFSGTKIYDALTRNPYGIHLGGCLDEDRILDFSYLPFSKQQASQKRGYATIPKYDEKAYFGPVILPGPPDVDNSQTL